MSEMKWGVDSQHPSIVNAINNMITKGFGKEAIVKIVGCPPEVVDSHMIRRGASGAPRGHEEERHREYTAKKREETKKKTRVWTDEQRQAARDRMAKVREAKGHKLDAGS
jgi:hypothetical protein